MRQYRAGANPAVLTGLLTCSHINKLLLFHCLRNRGIRMSYGGYYIIQHSHHRVTATNTADFERQPVRSLVSFSLHVIAFFGLLTGQYGFSFRGYSFITACKFKALDSSLIIIFCCHFDRDFLNTVLVWKRFFLNIGRKTTIVLFKKNKKLCMWTKPEREKKDKKDQHFKNLVHVNASCNGQCR